MAPVLASRMSNVLLAVATLLLVSASMLPAATGRMWTGGSATSGNWTSAANWESGAPVAGDILSFPDSGGRRTSNTNNFPAGTAFSSINFFDTGYRLRGNSVTISNYVTAGLNSGTNTVDLNLLAAGPGVGITLRSFSNGDLLILNGDINLNNRTLTTEGPADFRIAGVISGTGGIYKNNSGDLSLSGLGANTFTGSTLVNSGILRLNRYIFGAGLTVIGTTAIPGNLAVGALNGTLVSDIVVLDRDNQIADTSSVTVASTGSLELSGESDTIGELDLLGGFVSTGTGILSVDGGIYAAVGFNNKDSVIAGRLSLGARVGEPQLINVAQGVLLHISAAISGGSSSDLVKTNRGELFLSASNTFSGDVEILGGTVIISHGSALGNTTGVTRPRVGTLAINGTIGIPETLVVPGPAGLLAVNSGSPSWLGSVVLNDDLDIMIPTNSFLNIVGQISGPAGWTKFGDGTLQFKTPYTNSYAGAGWVREGNLILDGVMNQPVISGPLVIGNTNDPADSTRVWPIKQNQIGDTIPVTLHKSGLLQLGTFNDTVGSIAGAGNISVASGGSLVVGRNDQSTTFSGVMSGTGRLQKVGAGTLTLRGTNSYTGETALSEGTLMVHGSIAASSLLRLNEPIAPTNLYPSILSGTGRVCRIVSFANGIIAPGASPGRLTVQGECALSNAVVRLELNGSTPGVSSDQLRVNGVVKLGNSRLDLTLGFTPALDDSFILIQNDGSDPVQGTFQGLPQGSHVSAGGLVFYLDYTGGDDDNDVVLTRVSPPSSSISSLARKGDDMVIQGEGLPGASYVLEFAPHLNPPIPWSALATNTANSLGVYEFSDGGIAFDPKRFYRVR